MMYKICSTFFAALATTGSIAMSAEFGNINLRTRELSGVGIGPCGYCEENPCTEDNIKDNKYFHPH
eukprot:CAMPEP_0183306430 /NCGR_PEP_ID=MMETSP0160_2-20130417/11302_1 /TAXON_ID=2839 ORGANISM="Odontella Sinensis, Strain Grunow 1884" /NCGR_SAMPLE_ID=MMETSP0160_2 /ASSEMBLY_ACC=CAM_ASM_000250 /LENGTH=65 /DNA_ID=CAMNT_0025469795 /DNA_START=88 /DNA_END=282 /DNA_ORIENTATION=+